MMKNDFLPEQSGGRGSFLLNFLLNFGVAVVWLGRWTIRLAAKLWQRWSR